VAVSGGVVRKQVATGTWLHTAHLQDVLYKITENKNLHHLVFYKQTRRNLFPTFTI